MQKRSRSNSSNRNKKIKAIDSSKLMNITPLTENQEKLFSSYREGKCIVANGVSGTGKTFGVLFNALKEVLDYRTPYEKIYILRSIVPTRDIGFMPGDLASKTELYETPYKSMVKYMFDLDTDEQYETLYSNLKMQSTISFWTTSFLRGTTFDRCIIIVDEMQNLSYHECSSIITRVGEDCKIFFCGDYRQSDLRGTQREGILNFLKVIGLMPSFDVIEFGVDDIVRSNLVREFIIAEQEAGVPLM